MTRQQLHCERSLELTSERLLLECLFDLRTERLLECLLEQVEHSLELVSGHLLGAVMACSSELASALTSELASVLASALASALASEQASEQASELASVLASERSLQEATLVCLSKRGSPLDFW